jgi:hypothetical protein
MKKQISISIIIISILSGCSVLFSPENNFEKISVKLYELPDSCCNKLTAYFDITKIDKNNNSISLTNKSLEKGIQNFIKTGIINQEIQQFDFYTEFSHPRLCYWEYIINQLPSWVSYGYRYDSYSKRADEKGRLFSYLVYNIDRSPEQISRLFNSYKNIIYEMIDSNLYRDKHLDLYVKTLVKVYHHLIQMDDYEEQMKRIYNAVEDENKDPDIFGRTSNQFPIYEPVLNEDVIKMFKGTNGMVMNDWGQYTDVLWFHSFWLRRYHEGNSEAVFQILQEIEEHYN